MEEMMKPAIVDLILIYKQMIRDARSKVRKDILGDVVLDLERILREAQ